MEHTLPIEVITGVEMERELLSLYSGTTSLSSYQIKQIIAMDLT
jgi:hypothetical protein